MSRASYPLKLSELKMKKLKIMAIENDTNVNIEINAAIANHIRNHNRRKNYRNKNEHPTT